MAQTTQINFRIDKDIKRDAEKVLDDIGLSMSAAVTVFLKKVGREHRIPFELESDPFYSESNMNHLLDLKRKIDNGTAHFTEHDIIEVDDE